MNKDKPNFNLGPTRIFALFVLLIIFLIGITLTAITNMDSLQEQRNIHQEISLFQEKVKIYKEASEEAAGETSSDSHMSDLRSLMEDYNKEICENGQENLVDAWSYRTSPFDLDAFDIKDEVVGVVSIPKINVEMPLYLGANDRNLVKGCAVLTQTSMPIGGENTNCVIAAHRGWNKIPFVRDIEEVTVGDSIFIENFWETMEYRVTEIRIIYPHEYRNILIQPGKDMLTIITCHPYHVNSHRYLVFAERYDEISHETQPQGEWITEERNRAAIMVSDGINFQSSRTEIFLHAKLPMILLSVAAVLLVILLIILAIHVFQNNNKSRSSR